MPLSAQDRDKAQKIVAMLDSSQEHEAGNALRRLGKFASDRGMKLTDLLYAIATAGEAPAQAAARSAMNARSGGGSGMSSSQREELLEGALRKAKRENESLRRQLGEAQRAVQSMAAKVQDLEHNYERVKAENQRLRRTASQQEGSVTREQFDEIVRHKRLLEQMHADAEQARVSLATERSDLRERADLLAGQLSEAREQIENFGHERAALKRQIDLLRENEGAQSPAPARRTDHRSPGDAPLVQ